MRFLRGLLCVAAGFVLGWLLRPLPQAPAPLSVPQAALPAFPAESEDLAALRARLQDQDAIIALLRKEVAEQDRVRAAAEARLTQPQREQSARKASVAGTWASNCGPVTLEHPPVKDGKPVPITGGSWLQEEKYHGRITGGTFDPATGAVRFTWYQDWDLQEGETKLQMSPDGRRLVGSYLSKNGGAGHWNLARDGANVEGFEIEDRIRE